MALKEYRKKRDFSRTPEPAGAPRPKRSRGELRYVIQKHAATRLHYDFRLEWKHTLKSWAVPKGPSLDPAAKRLAVEVEDHPVEYGKFEGTIPRGHYGAGSVELWDQGTWEPLEDADQGLKEGRLKFRLYGDKLEGLWALVRMAPRDGEKKSNWLLIKDKDEFARRKGDITKERPESVAAPPARAHVAPARIEPQLATLVTRVPEGKEWLFEIKFDGYRILSHLRRGEVALQSRNGKDWTDRFASVASALARLKKHDALLDGEVVVLQPDGTTDFQVLQNQLKRGRTDDLVYYVFDLLRLDGKDLTGLPLLERKRRLQRLVKELGKQDRVRYTDHVVGPGARVLEQACRLGLEGVIAKRADAPYRGGRGTDWLKLKCVANQEFVIAGFTDPAGSRKGLGALLLGVHEDGNGLRYAGKVGTGFSDESLRQLAGRLSKLETARSPFRTPPARMPGKTHWVRPTLVAQIAFTEWTRDGLLRHPSFQGLREDKPARAVVRERQQAAPSRSPSPARAARGAGLVGGVRLTHPDRVIYPGLGITKEQLAEYYLRVADRMLPEVVGRPLMLLRCPEGEGKPCFFQKHAGETIPKGAAPVKIPDAKGGPAATYLRLETVAGLIGLVQIGVIEVHVWGSRVPHIEKPDRIVFDLDPDPSVPWERVVAGALRVRQELERRGLTSFVKTTGGKGLHVVAPIDPVTPWAEVKTATRQIASAIAKEDPKGFTAVLSKARRKGKIFLDYLRNGRGSTWVAPYSARARAGAGVSMPLSWSALARATNGPGEFTVQTVAGARLPADPWKDIAKVRQKLAR